MAFSHAIEPGENERGIMLLNLGGPMAFSHAAVLYPSLPHAVSLAVSTPESCTGPLSNNSMNSMTRSRRPTRPSSGALFLHPSGSLPAGVSSSLFTLKPRATPKTYPVQPSPSDGGSGGGGGGEVAAALDVRLVEETDLAEISALLAEVFEPSILIDPAELRSEASVERLEKANKYLKDMAYKKILRAIKSRCGSRLRRGDYALSSDALVLAVRDNHKERSSSTTGATTAREQQQPEVGADGGASSGVGGGDAGEIVAIVELCLRQPDGWFPFNWLFLQEPLMGWEPYMCNLAVAEKYRGNGYGKQLVQLCENVAKNHWGYERMYLHVDADSHAAMSLYSSMGYEIQEQFEPPRWIKKILGLRDIQYQVKHFNIKKGPVLGG